MNFIENLQNKRSQYNYADQARTQAESLKQLSAGIYTEEERFVYELLQNAVDAFVDTSESNLNIRIEIKGNMLCFMHNGAPFSERDIEGLCDVGRSNKASDSNASNKKKVGYKGIGFKSVFMQSVEYVCVKSGDYCFKFDKNECVELMPEFSDGPLTADEIPWQIIPIACSYSLEFDISNYNVATFIKTETIKGLIGKINALLSNPQFLLFLNAANISIELYNEGLLDVKAGRKTVGEEVHLLSDNVIVSRWLVHTTELIPVDNNVREYLRRDFNTPQKLKEATHFEISFGILINESGELTKVDNSIVYTFLPTSYRNLGLPFLVNANFITDAGRQQLHQNSKWNGLIFEKIPEYYLKWIASLSPIHKDYYNVLPNTKSQSFDILTTVFDEALKKALSIVPFIPRLKDDVVIKTSDAIIDKVGIFKAIEQQELISHINRKYGKTLHKENFIANEAITLFKKYGVFVFDKTYLPRLFEDTNVFNQISVDYDVKLIEFLHSYDQEHNDEQVELRQMLNSSRFLLDENNNLNAPKDIFFPSDFRDANEVVSKVTCLHGEVSSKITDSTYGWLKDSLGLRELSNISFIDYLYEHRDYITEDNAIEVGRFLFKINEERNIFDSVKEYKLRVVKFLSQNGSLCSANELYLGDSYMPALPFEKVCDDDIFVSSSYLPSNADNTDIAAWKLFFLRFGLKEDIIFGTQYIEKSDSNWKTHIDAQLFESAITHSEKYKNSYAGLILDSKELENISISDKRIWDFSAEKIRYESYPLMYLCNNYSAAKILISRILASDDYSKIETDASMSVVGSCGFYGLTISENNLEKVGFNSGNHTKWLIDNKQIIPTTRKGCDYARNVFSNSIDRIYELAGSYLPIVDATTIVSDEWLKVFPFKRQLMLQDYLTILAGISQDQDVDNKERVTLIYEKIVELGYQNDPQLLEWGKINKLLSTIKGEFMSPTELSYITIDGFKNENRVYLGKVAESLREGVLNLLKNFGVKVITKDNISHKVEGEIPDDTLKGWLQDKLQYIAVLKGDTANATEFEKSKTEIGSKIGNSVFYNCKSIQLSYGDENDVVPKLTFSNGNKFYYTGSLSPSKLEPLMQPLSRFLGLKGAEKELLIIVITKNHDEIVEFLKDKGYNTEFLVATGVIKYRHEDETDKAGRGQYEVVSAESEDEMLQSNEERSISILKKLGYDVNKKLSKLTIAQESYNDTYLGDIYIRDGVSIMDQIELHKEAMEAAKKYLECKGYDLIESDYSQLVGDSDMVQKWHSACQIHNVKTPSGEYVNVIVKSCKGGFIYLSATDFQSLTSSRDNILILYDNGGCHSVSYEELFAKGSDVNLIFDTAYTPQHYYAALGKIFTYIKRSTFAVKNPCYNITYEIKGFGMDSETQGLQNEFDDDNDL